MLRGLEGWHIVLIVGVAVLLFGSRKLPDAARSVGQSLRIFKSEMKAATKDGFEGEPASAAPVATPPQAVQARVVTPPVTVVNETVPSNVAGQG
jgi:sec-independent protein translocase protein TatA